MKIQIWGKSKCFDTKKAERWFKERRIKYQYIDLLKYGISRGELMSVKAAVPKEPATGLRVLVTPCACWMLLLSSELTPQVLSGVVEYCRPTPSRV